MVKNGPPDCPVQPLITPYADVLVDDTEPCAIGAGWRPIAEELFAAWAVEVRRTPGARLSISTVQNRLGRLHINAEAAKGLPPGRLDLREIRRLEHVAEAASLRTCDCCGAPGMLRRVNRLAFATRCEAHVHLAVPHMLPDEAFVPLEVVKNSLTSHADWLDWGEARTEIPRGWLGLAVEALAKARTLPAAHEGEFRLLDMRGVCGRLVIRVVHDIEALDLPAFFTWQAHLLSVGDAGLFTCEVCGGEGRLRRTQKGEGAPAPRCDAHADMQRWRSLQVTASTRIPRDLVVISSERRYWTIEAVREAVAAMRVEESTVSPRDGIALYELADVAAALGLAHVDDDDPFDTDTAPRDTEQQSRLRRILNRGQAARWRRLACPNRAMIDQLDLLAERAPHLGELSDLIRRHLRAALHMGLPIRLPPLLVVGPPGAGKTWFLTAAAEALGVPFRALPLTGASHSDTIGGSHGVWRNSQAGLVAKTLMSEEVANPIFFIDEFDKAPAVGVDDLLSPFYVLLEPAGSRRFVDAFLGFPMDTSHVNWVLAANDTTPIPAPILSRCTVLNVGLPDEAQVRSVALSVYADCNGRMGNFFPSELRDDVLRRLIGLSPRKVRLAIEEAMMRAAAAERDEIFPEDVPEPSMPERTRVGFL